jgi:hypothetical protein
VGGDEASFTVKSLLYETLRVKRWRSLSDRRSYAAGFTLQFKIQNSKSPYTPIPSFKLEGSIEFTFFEKNLSII